jgi:hypothetical protein
VGANHKTPLSCFRAHPTHDIPADARRGLPRNIELAELDLAAGFLKLLSDEFGSSAMFSRILAAVARR